MEQKIPKEFIYNNTSFLLHFLCDNNLKWADVKNTYWFNSIKNSVLEYEKYN